MDDFHGLKTLRLSSPYLHLEYLLEAGPRIVRLMLAGSTENLLAETPDVSWPTPDGDYYLRGGHRLWHAPEAPVRSDVPDNHGLAITRRGSAVRLTQPIEAATGLRKSIEIELAVDAPCVAVRHQIENDGGSAIELAPWAITMLPLGGRAIIPQHRATDHPLLPDRHVVAWPYTRWHDARLCINDDTIVVNAHADEPPCKIGCLSTGWIGYLRNDIFFVKQFDPQLDRLHPDRDCNVEVYSNHRFIEIETLAPLINLAPGQTTEHVETWHIIDAPAASTPAELIRLVENAVP
ncbi:MAG: hypothetical protein HY870_03010 [Chloroflexi bacterium]|nr:hypothetical protein [Chloroflexota bacterium]